MWAHSNNAYIVFWIKNYKDFFFSLKKMYKLNIHNKHWERKWFHVYKIHKIIHHSFWICLKWNIKMFIVFLFFFVLFFYMYDCLWRFKLAASSLNCWQQSQTRLNNMELRGRNNSRATFSSTFHKQHVVLMHLFRNLH